MCSQSSALSFSFLLPRRWQSWRDPAAYDTVQRSTQAMLAGNYSCQKPCSDWAGNLSCCDGIFIPTFFFRWVPVGQRPLPQRRLQQVVSTACPLLPCQLLAAIQSTVGAAGLAASPRPLHSWVPNGPTTLQPQQLAPQSSHCPLEVARPVPAPCPPPPPPPPPGTRTLSRKTGPRGTRCTRCRRPTALCC